MKNEPLISICIPTYNGEKYLRKCLDSCLNQTYSAIEIIIVDDGSNDKTPELLQAYALADPRIKLFQNEKNLGLVQNWNRCMELATGEWIKFVFQDDYLAQDCLQKFVNAANSDTQLIISKRSFILPENADSSTKKYYFSEVRTVENTKAKIHNGKLSAAEIAKIAAENICLNFIAEPSLAFFKKSILSEVGNFDADFAQICDLEYFLRVGSTYGLTYIPEKLCHFRIHSASTTSSNLGAKSYILSHIDPILLVHHMLYSLPYTLLRKNLSESMTYKLKTYLKVRTYEAFIESKKSKENEIAFNKVADKFVEIKKISNASFTTKFTYLLIKIKRRWHS